MPSITIDGETVEYSCRQSQRAERPQIQASLHGVEVVVPTGMTVDAEQLMEERSKWLLDRWRRLKEKWSDLPERDFVEGETFKYLGRPRTLYIDDRDNHLIGEDRILLANDSIDGSTVRNELETLYRSAARERFYSRAGRFAEPMDVEFDRIFIRDQKTRWGSCSQQKNLNFNYRLLMAPPAVFDYVVVHELAHLHEANHSQQFWDIVATHCDSWKEHRVWLEENGHTLVFSRDYYR